MAGAPSQLELFDYKPKLVELEGQPIPPSVIAGQRYAFIQPDAAVLASTIQIRQARSVGCRAFRGDAALWPKSPTTLPFIKSVHTDQFNHSPAQIFVNTGSPIPGRPAMGSWLSYGIGSEANDLPGFVVLKSGGNLSGGASMWSAGFLPGEHQGVPFRASGDPILHIANPPGIDRATQRDTIDLIASLNRRRFDRTGVDEIQTTDRILRNGVSDAVACTGTDGLFRRISRHVKMYGVGQMTKDRSPRIVCWRGVWPSAVFVSFSSIIPAGIITAMSKMA